MVRHIANNIMMSYLIFSASVILPIHAMDVTIAPS